MMRTAVPATCTELATMRERGGGVQQWVDYDHVVYLLHFSNTEASRCSLSRRKGKLLGYGRLVQTVIFFQNLPNHCENICDRLAHPQIHRTKALVQAYHVIGKVFCFASPLSN